MIAFCTPLTFCPPDWAISDLPPPGLPSTLVEIKLTNSTAFNLFVISFLIFTTQETFSLIVETIQTTSNLFF